MSWLSILDNLLTLVLAGCAVVVVIHCVAKLLADFAGCDD